MANRLLKNPQTLEQGVVTLYGKVVTGSSGAISSQSCKGFSVAKTGGETGRYTVTLVDKYNALLMCEVVLEGTADAAMTSAKGILAFLRNVSMTTGTFDVQFCDPDGSAADANVEDAATIRLAITLKNSTAY